MSDTQDHGHSLPIDHTALAVISNGDAAVERRLVDAFYRASAADAATLNAAVEQRDAVAVIRAAHRVLGASKMAGAVTLAAICVNTTRAAQARDWDAIALSRDTLIRELERVSAYLDTLLNARP